MKRGGWQLGKYELGLREMVFFGHLAKFSTRCVRKGPGGAKFSTHGHFSHPKFDSELANLSDCHREQALRSHMAVSFLKMV